MCTGETEAAVLYRAPVADSTGVGSSAVGVHLKLYVLGQQRLEEVRQGDLQVCSSVQPHEVRHETCPDAHPSKERALRCCGMQLPLQAALEQAGCLGVSHTCEESTSHRPRREKRRQRSRVMAGVGEVGEP